MGARPGTKIPPSDEYESALRELLAIETTSHDASKPICHFCLSLEACWGPRIVQNALSVYLRFSERVHLCRLSAPILGDLGIELGLLWRGTRLRGGSLIRCVFTRRSEDPRAQIRSHDEYPQRKDQTMNDKKVENGVNVEALLGAREALRDAPEGAKFAWRATCKWISGTHSRSTVNGFFGLGKEQKHRTEFTFEADHPEIFASEDNGATPVELVLAGLASCLTAGIASVAQNRNIQLRAVTATLEGGMDIQGILGIDKDVRTGFDGIKVTYEIDADASKDDIKALVAQSQKRSAVFDIVTNPTNVTVEVV